MTDEPKLTLKFEPTISNDDLIAAYHEIKIKVASNIAFDGYTDKDPAATAFKLAFLYAAHDKEETVKNTAFWGVPQPGDQPQSPAQAEGLKLLLKEVEKTKNATISIHAVEKGTNAEKVEYTTQADFTIDALATWLSTPQADGKIGTVQQGVVLTLPKKSSATVPDVSAQTTTAPVATASNTQVAVPVAADAAPVVVATTENTNNVADTAAATNAAIVANSTAITKKDDPLAPFTASFSRGQLLTAIEKYAAEKTSPHYCPPKSYMLPPEYLPSISLNPMEALADAVNRGCGTTNFKFPVEGNYTQSQFAILCDIAKEFNPAIQLPVKNKNGSITLESVEAVREWGQSAVGFVYTGAPPLAHEDDSKTATLSTANTLFPKQRREYFDDYKKFSFVNSGPEKPVLVETDNKEMTDELYQQMYQKEIALFKAKDDLQYRADALFSLINDTTGFKPEKVYPTDEKFRVGVFNLQNLDSNGDNKVDSTDQKLLDVLNVMSGSDNAFDQKELDATATMLKKSGVTLKVSEGKLEINGQILPKITVAQGVTITK